MRWRLIKNAPKVASNFDPPRDVILFGPGIGVKQGRAANYPMGGVFADISHVAGDLMGGSYAPTHWMPLPAPPKEKK